MKYEIGTQVQNKNGSVKVKVDRNTWVSRGRKTFEETNKIRLSGEQRVFHIDGDKFNDDPDNLQAICFGVKEYNLSKAKVIWSPAPVMSKGRRFVIPARRQREAVAA